MLTKFSHYVTDMRQKRFKMNLKMATKINQLKETKQSTVETI